jgi:hypothetical protein
VTDSPGPRTTTHLASALVLSLLSPALAWAAPPAKPAPSPLADARGAKLTAKPVIKPAPARGGAANDACVGLQLAPESRAPFAPGEELAYDLSIGGLYLGKVELKAGKPRTVDGRRAESFFGRARTSGFASALKAFAGRYMAVVDSSSYQAYELRSEATYGDDARHEIARFSADHHNLAASYRMNGKSAERSYNRASPIYDMLTLLYHSRRLPLPQGTRMCQEVYADKRLWRADAEVAGLTRMSTPVGEREVIEVRTRWVRLPHPDFDPKREAPSFDVDIFYTNDMYRAPVAFLARTKDFTARGDLVRWSTADRSSDTSSWSF